MRFNGIISEHSKIINSKFKEILCSICIQEQGAFAEGIGPTPELILNSNKTNFYDFTIEDFEMLYYNPIKPQLKLELGI